MLHFDRALASDSTDYEANWRGALALITLGQQTPPSVKSPERDSLYARAERLARRAVQSDSLGADGHFILARAIGQTALSKGTKERIRLAVNAAAARPLRLTAVEDAVRGKEPNAATGEMAGRLAVQGARPLRFNGYKIPLMRNLVKRAIGGVEKAEWA